MKRIATCLALGLVVLGATCCTTTSATAEAYYVDASGNNVALTAASPAPQHAVPVLFVHGHNPIFGGLDPDGDPHFRHNWQEPTLLGLPSFRQTLEEAQNAWLDIEAYYIRFKDQRRSIADDANEIAAVVELILQRHDSSYSPGGTTSQRIAIIAYSKGTISSRLYLKNRVASGAFNPVSEFVAVAPPNHGTAFRVPAFLSLQQLNNGYSRDGSVSFPSSKDFIEDLNGHAIADSLPSAPIASHASEAPGSRADGSPVSSGTLYVALYASDGKPDDIVGGDTRRSGFQGRLYARNMAAHAVNRPLDIDGPTALVHPNTVHDPDVICHALYVVAHHQAPPAGLACTPVSATNPAPLIPTSP